MELRLEHRLLDSWVYSPPAVTWAFPAPCSAPQAGGVSGRTRPSGGSTLDSSHLVTPLYCDYGFR